MQETMFAVWALGFLVIGVALGWALGAARTRAGKAAAQADLDQNRRSIEAVLNPVKESLDKVDGKIHELERERGQAMGRLSEQLRTLATAHDRLSTETGKLSGALRAPAVRGRWGEIQLRRAVELAGMKEHCDFEEQVTLPATDDNVRRRPDMVVRLPGDRHVIVDSKVPLEAYLDATQASSDEERRERLLAHAAQVRAHAQKLGAKAYWSELPGTPEFVVMFLPSDAIYAAALEAAPTLIEDAMAKRVLLATPTTLIALLAAVHYGWREERIADNAQKVSELGRKLHERVATLVEHWARLGTALGKATEHYNAAASSFESRVVPAARRLEELGAGSAKAVISLPRLDVRPCLVTAPGESDEPGAATPAMRG